MADMIHFIKHFGTRQVFMYCIVFIYLFIEFVMYMVALGGLVVSVLATGPKVRGFDPDRGHNFLRRRNKAVGPMSWIYGMNRTSNARRQNSAAISHPSLLTACQMALAVTSGLK
jgi:hypothetical protein